MNVNWHGAQEYVEWLSQKTGQNYRLPSKAEWEYAARAGTTGRFSIGDCVTTDQANFYGYEPPEGCPAGIWRQRTVAAASFAANPWGVYEMNGNVWELVQDCWNDGYYGESPTDGSAWMSGDCDRAPIRGGAWATVGRCLRSGMRDSISRSDRFSALDSALPGRFRHD